MVTQKEYFYKPPDDGKMFWEESEVPKEDKDV